MRRFFILFTVLGLLAYGCVYLPPVRGHIIGPFTEGITQVSGRLIRLFGGQVSVHGNTLAIPGFAVQVLDMCNGVEATILLWTAIVAFPAPWGHKLKGLLVGTLTVHALNIIRIVSLLYLGAYRPQWFYWVHWYLWDTLIMLDILIVFLAWVRLMPMTGRSNAAAAV